MWPSIRFGFLALPLYAALAQVPPDVGEILKKVGQTYKAVKDYELVADATVSEDGAKHSGHFLFAFQTAGRYRMEGAMPGMSMAAADSENAVAVHDGTTVWYYLPTSNRYASFPASELTEDAPGDLADMRPSVLDRFIMWRYRGATDLTAGAKYLRDETIDVAGAKVACYVIAVSPGRGVSAYTWWVDTKRYYVLREDQGDAKAGASTVYTTIKLNEPLPADLFKFVPPAGAKKIENK